MVGFTAEPGGVFYLVRVWHSVYEDFSPPSRKKKGKVDTYLIALDNIFLLFSNQNERRRLTAVADSGGMEHMGSWLTGLGCVREIVVAVSGATAPCFNSICFFSCSSSSIFLFVNSTNRCSYFKQYSLQSSFYTYL